MAVHCHNGCEYDHLNEYAARLLRENEQLWQFVNSCTNSIDAVVRDKSRRLASSKKMPASKLSDSETRGGGERK